MRAFKDRVRKRPREPVRPTAGLSMCWMNRRDREKITLVTRTDEPIVEGEVEEEKLINQGWR